MSESQRVVVTGGAGFIGSHVVDAYLARGHQVWVVDNLSSGRRDNLADGVEFLEADIGAAEVRDLIREVKPHIVNHHAAQIDVRVSVEDPRRDARTNIDGLLNLTEGALEAGTRRFVFVSSGGVVYGEPEVRPTPEETTKAPLSPYGVTKLAGEYYLNYYRRVHGLEYVALRYSNVFGPRQDPHGEAGVVAIFCNRLLASEALTIFGDGEQTRDYVFVGDVAQANMVASEMALPKEPSTEGLDEVAFNVGTGLATSVNRLADALEEIAGIHPGRDYRGGRAGELRHSTLDASKMRDRAWAPQVSITEALQETYEYIAQTRIATP